MRAGINLAICLAMGTMAIACTSDDSSGFTNADDLLVTEVYAGLVGPTQQVVVDQQTLLVGQLNGGESEAVGQVLEIDLDSGEVSVLFEGLDKPTGVLLVDSEVWVMEKTRLARGPRAGGNLETVVGGLANNGRSQGTLTLTPEGKVLFNTSGSRAGAELVEGSGRLWLADPDTGEVVELASGFKHSYAHTFDGDANLWTTEMSDGRYDGDVPVDEVVAVVNGVNHGWPVCVGDNRPVAELGASEDTCDGIPPSHAVFAPGATPTSIVVSPFDPGQLLVALWNEQRVISIPRDAGAVPHQPTTFLNDLVNPQHMVAVGDELWLTEFGKGRILKISA